MSMVRFGSREINRIQNFSSITQLLPFFLGNGFFLFSKEALQKKNTSQCGVPGHDPDSNQIVAVNENETGRPQDESEYTQEVLTVIAPFWYWW